MASFVMSILTTVGAATLGLFTGSKKKAALSEMVPESHEVTTTNPFHNTTTIQQLWSEWEEENDLKLEARPYLFYSMTDLESMKDTIELRKQAKALNPNTTDYAHIRIKQPQILFFCGIYYKVGVFSVKTDDADLNEHKEVCPKNKDGSLRPPFIAYDHPLMHELLDFAFKDIGAADLKIARANISKDYFSINWDKVGLPFWQANFARRAAPPAAAAPRSPAAHAVPAIPNKPTTPFATAVHTDDEAMEYTPPPAGLTSDQENQYLRSKLSSNRKAVEYDEGGSLERLQRPEAVRRKRCGARRNRCGPRRQ